MGKMKDISIELEEAGLDPFDNSNLQGYVDDTHHFGEDVLKVVDYNTRDINVAAQFINNPIICSNANQNDNLLNIGQTELQESYPYRFGIDLASGPDLTNPVIWLKADQNGTLEKLKSMTGPFHVNGDKHSSIHINLTAPEGWWVSKRYSYSGRLAKGRLHYDVIDRHTREVVNTYRQIKKAKALVKELNRG